MARSHGKLIFAAVLTWVFLSVYLIKVSDRRSRSIQVERTKTDHGIDVIRKRTGLEPGESIDDDDPFEEITASADEAGIVRERDRDDERTYLMTDHLSQLLNCQARPLPIEALSHRFTSVSKSLKDFWNCMKDHDSMSVHLKRQTSAALCQRMEFDPSSEDLRLSRTVRCRNVLGFLRRANPDYLETIGAEDVFQLYLRMISHKLESDVYTVCTVRSTARSTQSEMLNDQRDLFKEIHPAESGNNRIASYSALEECDRMRKSFYEVFDVFITMHHLNMETRPCRETLAKACAKANLVVAEIHRASFSDLGPLIQRMPEVQTIFYVRDPRAVAVSRTDPQTQQSFVVDEDWTAVNESTLLCQRMWVDLEEKKLLEQQNPGSIFTIRYEDFIEHPREVVARAYGRLSRQVPAGFERWLNETMNSDTYDGIYGIRRKNSKEHISKWRSKVSDEEAETMTISCINVLKELGYKL